MKKLDRLEKRVFSYIKDELERRNVESRKEVLDILKRDLGFDSKEVLRMYNLWYYSKGEDFESYEYNEEGELIRFINTLTTLDENGIDKLTDDLYDSGMLDKLLGSDFSANCGGWNSNVPCISFKTDGIQLELDRETWEGYFSGLGEDDLWIYYQAHSSYGGDYEEVDSDEFNYVYTNDETIGHLKTLAIMAGKDNWPGKDKKIEEGEVREFLSEVLPPENFDRIVDDYLSELSIGITRSRENAASHCYEQDINYNTNTTRCESGDYCIFIPYEDLETMIVDKDLINLSELKNDEVVNQYVYLSDCWYDTWIDDEGYDDCINELNRSLDYTIEKLSEDVDLKELLKQRTEMMDMLKKMGFVKYTSTSTGAYYKSKDGKIDLHSDNINYKDKKIKFSYEGKQHLIPIEEFPNWVYGTPLDLNESVRVNKKLLKEQTEDINKISIFDFDGTLMKTPNSTEGKKQWEEFYGKDYPHIGWWGKPESLDDAVFDIQPIESTVSDYKKEMNNPNTFVIMLTGRLPHQSSQVEELLALHNIHFKEYHYKSNGDTLTSKLNTIKSLLNRFPQVKDIEMWEDRESHVIAFEEWGKENGINIKVNYITDGVVPLNESENKMNMLYDKIIPIMSLPYGDFLIKMGFDKDTMKEIFVKKFGPETRFKFLTREDDRYELYINDANRNQIYFETNVESMTHSNNKYVVYWEYFDGENKYRNSDGRKRYKWVEDNQWGTYDTQMGNWDNAPIEIKKDKFFTESEDKYVKYYNKLSTILKPPYIDNLKSFGVNYNDWRPVLSKIFNRDVVVSGTSVNQIDILEAKSMTLLYTEWDYKPRTVSWINYTNGESG